MDFATQVDCHQIASRLEQYLADLNGTVTRWQRWLSDSERQSRATESVGEANAFHLEGMGLLDELQRLVAARDQLLSEATDGQGRRVASLRGLAQLLPIWNERRFRHAFELAKQHIDQIRRLQIATWVTLRESANYYQESLELMMTGGLPGQVTIDGRQPDSGGQLLDASL